MSKWRERELEREKKNTTKNKNEKLQKYLIILLSSTGWFEITTDDDTMCHGGDTNLHIQYTYIIYRNPNLSKISIK